MDNKCIVVNDNYDIADIEATLSEGRPIVFKPNYSLMSPYSEMKVEDVKVTRPKAELALKIFEDHSFRGWRVLEIKH